MMTTTLPRRMNFRLALDRLLNPSSHPVDPTDSQVLARHPAGLSLASMELPAGEYGGPVAAAATPSAVAVR